MYNLYLYKIYKMMCKTFLSKKNIVYGKFRAFDLEAEIEKIMRQIEQ